MVYDNKDPVKFGKPQEEDLSYLSEPYHFYIAVGNSFTPRLFSLNFFLWQVP
jgi:hypothetical protein